MYDCGDKWKSASVYLKYKKQKKVLMVSLLITLSGSKKGFDIHML